MSDAAESAGWFLVGAGVAFSLLTLMRQPQLNPQPVATDAPTATAQTAPVPADGCPPAEPERVAALQDKLAALRAETTLLEAGSEAVEGTPLPWTASLELEVGEATSRQWLDARVGAYEATVTRMDCSEYPCLAVLSGPFGGEDIQQLDLAERFGGRRSTVMTDASGQIHVVALLAAEPLDETQLIRANYRMREAMLGE